MCLVLVFLGVLGGIWVWGVGVCVFLGGCVVVFGCVWCAMAFVNCVDKLVGEIGSRVVEMWLCGSVRLCVEWFSGCVLVCVLRVLLVLVSEICVRCGGFRRLPALKVSVVTGGCFGDVAWLLGLGCLVGGVGEAVSFLSCSVVRVRLRWVGGVGVELL